MDIASLIKEARRDPALLSSIDINKLLQEQEVDSLKYDFLGNQSVESISENVFDSIKRLPIDKSIIATHCEKLVGYRFVDELHLLHKGKYVRWIRHDEPDKIMKGGILVDIQFGDFGANILCRSVNGMFLRYRFDKCNTYQKMTEDEQLYLMMNQI
jgi:hypothetical protein